MKEKSWIVVANSEKAKVYHVVRVGELKEVISMVHPERSMRASDIISDKPGRTFNRVGVSRHAYVPETSEEEKKDILFAREVAEFLNLNFEEHQFKNLYLVAEPRFLGVLKKHLPQQIINVIDSCLAKDLVNQHPDMIWELCEIPT
jgi:protein required for attachment to host cells